MIRSPVGLKLSRVIDGKLSEPNLRCARANGPHQSLELQGEVSQHLKGAIKYLSQSIDPQTFMFLEEYDPVHSHNLGAKVPLHYHSGRKRKTVYRPPSLQVSGHIYLNFSLFFPPPLSLRNTAQPLSSSFSWLGRSSMRIRETLTLFSCWSMSSTD